MQYSLRKNALAAIIGLSLAGAAWHTPAHAGFVSAATATSSQSNTVEPYIVEFVEDGLVRYQGGNAGMAATAPAATHSRKLDATSAAALTYGAYLESQRVNYIKQIDSALGRDLDVTHSYSITLNGIAADMSGAEAARIAQLPGVKSVRVAGVEFLTTYNSTSFIGANTIWDGTNTPTLTGTRGQGITVGILDSGANSSHPSFANNTACGFSASAPKLTARDCSTSSAGVCTGTNPQAASGNGHGVHTAGTVAGNTLDNSASPAPALPNGISMSGVAPCAAIISYKVCQTSSCGSADIRAGIENAIRDGVDVINFSISGGTNPWNDDDRRFLDAVNADIFVAASAGNTSETVTDPVGKVNHRGPWLMSVAASTQDIIIGPSLSLTWPGTPPADAVNVPLNPGSTTLTTPTYSDTPLRIDTNNIAGCTADGGFQPGTFTGAIAVVRRGVCPFTEKITNAVNAGATMVVIANNTFGSINMDTTGAPATPAFSISQTAGDAIISHLTLTPSNGRADVAPIAIGNTQPDVIADFSFRGPTPGNLSDLTKPDITAPGVNIYAATDTGSGNYEFMSGTSMSGPHIAGSAALLRSVHPNWSVTEIKSAIQTTASIGGFMENGSTAWNIDVVGSGRVDLRKAALAGLTLDETYARFLAANPSSGSINVKDLNLASVRNLNCTPNCTFTRTVTNRLATSGTWSTSFQTGDGITAKVVPSTFTLPVGGTQVLTITATPPANTTMTTIGFGNLLFTESTSQSPVQHFSVAIKGVGGPPEVDDIIFQDGFEAAGGGTPVPVALVLDDGSSETSIAWTDEDNILQYPSVWLNRFTLGAAQVPMALSNIQVLWPASSSAIGKSIKLVVYTDADGDGDPSNAVLVGQSDVTIGGLGSFESYPLSVSVTMGGDLYIGFVDTFAEGGTAPIDYVAAIDQDVSQNRSWIAAGDDVSPNITNLGANAYLDTIGGVSGGALDGNWMIRANGETTAGQPVTLD